MKIESTIASIEQALTLSRRKTIYRIGSGILLILGAHGVVTAETTTAYLAAGVQILGIGATELAARNVRDHQS